MKRACCLLGAAALGLIGFWVGMKAEQFRYTDLCLDLGGGRNPGNHPICVIER